MYTVYIFTFIQGLESRIAVLEDNQFSTTTKFTGNVFLNLTGANASDDVLAETVSLDTPFNLRRAGRDANNNPIVTNITEDPEITFSYYTWLNFNSSFTGKDNLGIQLLQVMLILLLTIISPQDFITPLVFPLQIRQVRHRAQTASN